MFSSIKGFFSLIKKSFNAVLGSASWTPPKWLQWCVTSVFGLGLLAAISYLRLLERKPKRFILANLILIATLAGSVLGYKWYSDRPKPATIALNINEIAATNLEAANSKPNPLIVEFSGSVSTLDKVGLEVDKDIEINPGLSGKWQWANDSRLEFNPDKDWEVGQTYTVNLKKRLFPGHILLDKYSFNFSSPKFIPQIESSEFYEDPSSPKNKQAVVKIKFTHPVDKSDLERRVSVRMRVEPVKNFDGSNVKKLGFKIIYNEKATEAYIRSDLLTIPEKEGEILVNIANGLRSARAGKPHDASLASSVKVPGVESYFKIRDLKQSIITNEKNFAAERIITISSTAAVSQEELSRNTEVLLIPDDKQLYQNPSSGQSLPAPNEESEEQLNVAEFEGYQSHQEFMFAPPMPEGSCPWSKVGQIPDSALKKATTLPISWLPNQKEFSSENSFKFEADVGRCIFVRIKKGTKSFGDYPLIDSKSFVQIAKPFSQDLKITDKGSLLALNGEKKIGVMSRGLNSVKFTLFRVLPNSLHHLSSQGFQYESTFSEPNFNYNFGPENISEVYVSVTTLPEENPGKPQYTFFDFGSYLNAHPASERGLFYLRATAYNPETKSDYGPRTERLVLVSNIGFIVKDKQDDSHQLYAMSTVQRAPISGATVEVLGKNGIAIFSGTTDDLGKVDLPSFKNYIFEKEPAVYVVKKDADLSFMPFGRSDRKLNFSRFDVGGLYTDKASESLQAYIFSDRGIYRPGETANLGLIIKSQNWKALADNIPFELSILDPRGTEIKKQKITLPQSGFQEFSYLIPDSALTGTHTFQISLVKPDRNQFLLGTTTIRVEEFLPDRLKINASLSQPLLKGWLNPEQLKIKVDLRNLYGTPANGHVVKSRLRLSPSLPKFSGWEDYSFFDPFSAKNSFNEDLGEVTTDTNGEASIELGLERFEKATYQLSAFVQGLEKEGGRSVASNVTALISPQNYLIGWKAGGDLSYIKKDFAQKARIVAVDQDLRSKGIDDLILERVEVRYISTLARQPGGSLAYQSVKKKFVRDTRNFSIPQDGIDLVLPSDEPGSFYYEIRDANGLILNSIPYSVVGQANLSRNMERNAELQIKLSKKDFAAEEEIEFEIQAPYTGSALVTIERDRVYAASWFKSDTTSSVQRIRVPKELEGNGYLNVAFVRSFDSAEIFTSPLSYAVEPFSVSKELRTERITLNTPKQIVPGAKLTIEASSATSGKAIIYAVDEGILQVARYKTPDPLSHFFRKRALEVQTQQITDLLLPEYRWAREFSAAGGDQDALLGKHRNPFKRKGQKPVIFWSGIVDLDPQTKSFSLEVPDYFNGSIKVFAVSVSDSKIGVVENQVTVQGDIVLSPNAPLFAAPGDEFTVSVVVANTKLPEGSFDVSLRTDSKLKVVSESRQALMIPSTKDAVASFQVKALDLLGNSDLVFMVKGQGSEARYGLNLSIRPAVARLNTLTTGTLKSDILGNREIILSLDRTLFLEESKRSVSFSTLPLSLAQGLIEYLEEYPHGCTEQITSQAFPALLLAKDPAFNLSPEKIQKIMSRTFALQGARQKEDGSFSFWPGTSDTDNTWISLHVARFLLEAKELGFAPPKSLVENSTGFLRQVAINSSGKLSLQSARNKAYAIYLLTRTGEVTTNYLQTLREELQLGKIKLWREDLLSLLMAASYKLLQQDKEAEELSKSVTIGFSADPQDETPLYSNTAKVGLFLDLVSRHFEQKARNIEPVFFEKIATLIADRNYSTVASANLIMGLQSFQKLLSDSTLADGIELLGSADGRNFAPLAIPEGRLPTVTLNEDIKTLKIRGKNQKNIFYQLSQSGFDKTINSKSFSNGIEIYREYRNLKGEPITEAKLGDDVTVLINLRSKDGFGFINNVAVIDLLPTGLEISGGTKGMLDESLKLNQRWIPQFAEAREDRALIYGAITDRIQQYSYRAKAVSVGTFVTPPVQAEAMYDPRVLSLSGGGKFIVK